MLAELLTRLQQVITEANAPKALDKQPDPRKLLVQVGGNVLAYDVVPPVRGHRVYSLSDLLEAAKRWGGEGVLWHNERQCVLVIDDGDRRDTVTLPLILSEKVKLLGKIGGQRFSQKDFIRLLKHDLAGSFPESVLGSLRDIVATSSGKAEGTVTPTKERGMREFTAELVNAKDIPEDVVLNVEPYVGLGLSKAGITCSLDYTLPPQPIEFRLSPQPDEIEKALRAAQAEISKRLSEAGTPVFYGEP